MHSPSIRMTQSKPRVPSQIMTLGNTPPPPQEFFYYYSTIYYWSKTTFRLLYSKLCGVGHGFQQ